MQTRTVARAVILTAVAVSLSPVFIPVGISKCFPAQHMVNVVAAVMLGPLPAVLIAFSAAVIRNLLGLGTLLAFPGGMIGALVAGWVFRHTRSMTLAALGEIFGTGILGALASAWVVGPMLMGKSMAVATLVIAFLLSTLVGSALGLAVLKILVRAGVHKLPDNGPENGAK